MTLMDLLLKYKPPNADGEASRPQLPHKNIVPIGLSGLQPLELQSRMLHTILECTSSKKEFLYLGQHVVPVCAMQLVTYASCIMES